MCVQALAHFSKSPPERGLVARLPRTSVLKQLSESDRELLDRLVEHPISYVTNESFTRRGIEQELFGAKAALVESGEPCFVSPKPIVEQTGAPEAVTLNTAQEQLAFKRMNYARHRCARILERSGGNRLTKSATWRLLAWARRALDVRSLIVKWNMPLVLAMAKRTRLVNVDMSEMISEGNMALLRSVEKFDCSRGYKFSTYSCRAILKSFSRVAMRQSRYRQIFPMEFDSAIEQSDHLEQKRAGVYDDCIDEIRDILIRNSAGLSDVERTVIIERFAINEQPGPNGSVKSKTLEQVGSMIGVTKERVRQIQNKALNKIKLALMDGYLAA